jgi:hypothetical protein
VQQLHQALGGAGGAQQVAIDLAEHGRRTGQNQHIDHGLAERAGAQAPLHHGLRAQVQAPEQAALLARITKATSRERARLRRTAVWKAGFRGLSEAPRLAAGGVVGLHRGHCVEHFGGHRAGVGDAVLAGAREAAHPAPEPDRGRDDEQQGEHDLAHHQRVVQTSMPKAPRPITLLRRPMLSEEPTTVCTRVVSALSRDRTSPVCVVSKNTGLCWSTWAYTASRRSAVMRSPSQLTV